MYVSVRCVYMDLSTFLQLILLITYFPSFVRGEGWGESDRGPTVLCVCV